MKWCEFMRKKGFMLILYFLDNDNRRIYKNGNCGKCIYDKKSIIEDLYTMPPINYIEASTKYKKYNSNFSFALHDKNILITKRLFMTATRRISNQKKVKKDSKRI